MASTNIVRVGQTSESSSTDADIAAIFEALSKKTPARLVLHFHGGLVPADDGIKIAEKMAQIYGDVGCHAVSFVWETGILETLQQGLGRAHSRRFFKQMMRYVIFFVLKSTVMDGARGGGAVDIASVDSELSRNGEFERFSTPTGQDARQAASAFADSQRLVGQTAEIEVVLSADPEVTRMVSESSTDDIPEDLRAGRPAGERGLLEMGKIALAVARIVGRVLERFATATDHGIYHTAMEEILRQFYLSDAGRYIWDGIKTRASEMWNPIGNPRVGANFLDSLRTHVREHPGTTVDLVGHSAGSIVICHLLRTFRGKSDFPPFRNVVLLAPACTMDLLAGELDGAPGQFKTFRLFAMKDELERRDRLIFPIYNRSLLYLVSGVLEDSPAMPLVGMDRHLGAAGESGVVGRFVHAAGENRLVLSTTGTEPAEGLRSDSISHGDFDDEVLTLASLAHMAAS